MADFTPVSGMDYKSFTFVVSGIDSNRNQLGRTQICTKRYDTGESNFTSINEWRNCWAPPPLFNSLPLLSQSRSNNLWLRLLS